MDAARLIADTFGQPKDAAVASANERREMRR